jgi:drug/metabolite transporter (DMT)-like permease
MSLGVRYILISTVFFAFMNIGVKYLDRIPAHEVVFFRALVSLVVCYAMVKRKGLNPWGNNKPILIARGLAGTGALTMYFYTLQNMPLATAVTVQYLSPIFTIIIAGFLLKETTRPIQWLFFLLSFGGILLIKGFDARVEPLYLTIGVLSAVCSGFAYNFIRMLKNDDDALVVVFYFPLVTVPLIGGYTLFHWVTPEPTEWLILIGIGLAVTVAQVYMTKAYQLERAANISNFNYLGTAYALVLGYFLFGEMIEPLALLGIAVIVIGVAMSTRFRQAG